MKAEDADKDEINSADFGEAGNKEATVDLSRREDSETTSNKNPDLSGNIEDSSQLAPVDGDKAALLARLVSASEILFRPIEEDEPGENTKEIYSRKSFLMWASLREDGVFFLMVLNEIMEALKDVFIDWMCLSGVVSDEFLAFVYLISLDEMRMFYNW